ncbi:MAG TPA: ABC transporter ATP-binding protein [Methylomirabilota bacterium]|nr:ABC transporter ATP-binding protein [Methylomirabilota bacterium]
MSLLELNHVSKSYGHGAGRTEVLHDVNLRIEEGEFVAIVGSSGAGKTTLISLIAGLIQPDHGQVLLRGQPITGPGPDRALVFQNYSLLPWLSVRDNVALAVDQCLKHASAQQRRDHVLAFLKLVNLSAALDKKPGQLSGGMRQRVALARALAMEPRILLLDEPLGALDALTRATLQTELEAIWRQTRKTVVMITNDVDEGLLLADRIIPLTAGPAATLGPQVSVDLPRPRDRKTLNQEPCYRQLRRTLLDFLVGAGRRPETVVTRKLHLPDIEPEDLTLRPSIFSPRRPPRRRNEVKEVRIRIDS